ncbi:MAG: NUDIX hydrolase [Candidatus Dojkabacteria bacterium]
MLAAGIIIINEGDEVLLGKRGEKSKNQQGKCESTSGRLERRESFEQAALREVKEESGVDIEDLKEVYSTPFYEEDEDLNWFYKVCTGRIMGDQEPKISNSLDGCSVKL